MSQGELEHRTSKSRYTHTSGRNFIPQLSQIERRQHRLKEIREKVMATTTAKPSRRHSGTRSTALASDDPPNDPAVKFSIGLTENRPVYIPDFLRNHTGDPAVSVSLRTSVGSSTIANDAVLELYEETEDPSTEPNRRAR